MSTLANYPKHLARRMAIRQRLAAEGQITRLAESIAYATEHGWLAHAVTLGAMRAEIVADIEAGKYWPSGHNVEGADGVGTHGRAAA